MRFGKKMMAFAATHGKKTKKRGKAARDVKATTSAPPTVKQGGMTLNTGVMRSANTQMDFNLLVGVPRGVDAYGFTNGAVPRDLGRRLLAMNYGQFEQAVAFIDKCRLYAFPAGRQLIRTSDLQKLIRIATGNSILQGPLLLALDLVGHKIRQAGTEKYGEIRVSKDVVGQLRKYQAAHYRTGHATVYAMIDCVLLDNN